MTEPNFYIRDTVLKCDFVTPRSDPLASKLAAKELNLCAGAVYR